MLFLYPNILHIYRAPCEYLSYQPDTPRRLFPDTLGEIQSSKWASIQFGVFYPFESISIQQSIRPGYLAYNSKHHILLEIRTSLLEVGFFHLQKSLKHSTAWLRTLEMHFQHQFVMITTKSSYFSSGYRKNFHLLDMYWRSFVGHLFGSVVVY